MAFNRRLRLVVAGVFVLAVTGIAGSAGSRYIEQRGQAFFATGQAIALQLEDFAAAVAARDAGALQMLYASTFASPPIGLMTRAPVAEKDGIAWQRFVPASERLDTVGALNEWQRYLASFSQIGEARAVVERVERWAPGRETTATIRLEIIGTPRSGASEIIDRALLRATFTGTPPLLA